MKSSTRNIALVAMFIALAVLVPIVFHLMGLGSMFLPMFLPILLSGFFLNPFYAGLVGLIGPIVSSLLTGMPPLLPVTPILCIEGFTLGLVSAIFYRMKKFSPWLCVLIALLVERIILILVIFLVIPLFGLPPQVFSIGILVTSMPGIILNLILVPLLVKLLKQRIK
jgi:LytS/YehU family sensor histidine kinase